MSLALHGVLLLALMLAFGHGHDEEHAAEPLARLVWVEPAPPAAAPLGDERAAGAETSPPTAPAPMPAPVERREPPLVREHVERPPRKPPAPREDHAPIPPPPAPVTAPEPVTAGAGAASGVAGASGDSNGGTRDGLAGGTVGGTGTTPIALRDVASPPELVDRVLPQYPARARAQEIEGQVVLEVVLDRNGRIENDVRVVRSIPLLDDAAVTAVRQWRFRPARDRDGRPVRVLMEVPVRFVLR